jgi:hypothetical protein
MKHNSCVTHYIYDETLHIYIETLKKKKNPHGYALYFLFSKESRDNHIILFISILYGLIRRFF